MFRIVRSLAVFVFFYLSCSLTAKPIALVGGRLIDGFGGPPLANSVILIEGERIVAVGNTDNRLLEVELMFHPVQLSLSPAARQRWKWRYRQRAGFASGSQW